MAAHANSGIVVEANMSGAVKAAAVLLHLPDEVATTMFSAFSRREIRQLSIAARELAKLSPQEVQAILEEFHDNLGSGTVDLRGGADYVAQLAERSLGPEKAQEVLQETESGGLLDALSEVDSRTLAGLLRKEHPQTTALIVAHLDPKRAAETIQQLPETVQPDVLRRVAKLDSVSPDVVRLLSEAFVSEVKGSMGKGGSHKVGGVNLLADIMNSMEKSLEMQLMEKLDEMDGALAETVRNLMFVFDDIASLDDRGIQTLLKEIERETLVLALKAADEDLKNRIFKNLSARAVEMIVEDMDGRGPVRLSEVERAQSEIVQIALKLSERGLLELTKGGDETFV